MVNPPTILNEVTPPTLSDNQVLVVTRQDAEYYSEACEAFREDSEDAGNTYVGLTEESACNWAIYGFTTQGWFNLQQNLILLENYVGRLKEQNEFHKKQLRDRYEDIKVNMGSDKGN